MQAITTIVLAVQMLTAIGMIGLILLQHGKGADTVSYTHLTLPTTERV